MYAAVSAAVAVHIVSGTHLHATNARNGHRKVSAETSSLFLRRLSRSPACLGIHRQPAVCLGHHQVKLDEMTEIQ